LQHRPAVTPGRLVDATGVPRATRSDVRENAASDEHALAPRASRRLGPWLIALSAYATLAVAATWPLAARLNSAVPHDPGDPLFSTWILWWNAHVLPLTARWWDAPVFTPLGGALSLSEHLLGLSVIATPMQWLGAAPITAYNTVFLASFPLCAIAAHALAHEITGRHDAAAVAGLAYGFNPYRLSQISHVQMLWVFWTPLALLALHRYARDGRRRWVVAFAVMWIGQALSNSYFVIFFPILLALWVVWFLTTRPLVRAAIVAAAWGFATLALLPIIVRYAHVNERFAVERTYGEIQSFGAPVDALLSPAPIAVASAVLPSTGNAEQHLFPGVAVLALVAIAALLAWLRARTHSPRRPLLTRFLWCAAAAALAVAASAAAIGPWRFAAFGTTLLSVTTAMKPLTVALWFSVFAIASTSTAASAWRARSAFAFYAAAAAVLYAFSFGPEPTLLGVPFWYRPPSAWLLGIPGLSNMRVPARFAMVAILCLAVAAAIAFDRLRALVPRRAAGAFVVVTLAFAAADGWILDLPLADIPPPPPALDLPSGAVVVELPLGTVAGDTAAMYRSLSHGRPIVNGYSGFEPVHYTILREALEAGDIDALDGIGAGRAVMILDDHGRRAGMRTPKASSPQPRGRMVAIRSAAASSGALDAAALADGNRDSFWESGMPQCGTEWVTMDLGALHRVDAIVMSLGRRLHDYPRALAIDVSDDRREWRPAWAGRTAARAVAGALENPAMIPLAFELGGVRARWLRLRQVGADPRAHWSIAEVRVYGE